MISALSKSFAQIPDPRFRKVWLLGLLYSVALFVAIVVVASFLLAQIEVVGIGWIDWIIAALGSAGAFILAIILFPGLALMVIGLLLERICRAVEAKHYPDLPAPRNQSWGEIFGSLAKLIALTVFLNIIVLPLYFIPVINLLVFYVLNGILLGREYFDLVSMRRLDPSDATAMRRRHRGRIFADGVVIVFLLSIPFVGWAMAVIATAFMLHEFESLKR